MTATITPISPISPTAEQLRLAWRHVSRPGWPPTLEAALRIPHYSTCLHAMARNLYRPPFGHRAPPQPVAALPTAPPVSTGITRRSARFDYKRAAANDLED